MDHRAMPLLPWWTAPAASLCLSAACFDPDRSTNNDDDDDDHCQSASDCRTGYTWDRGECIAPSGSCSIKGNGCETNGACCDFNGTTAIGAGLCVNYGGAAVCTNVYRSHSDCDTGCCGALEDEGYGACASASVCEGDSTVQPSARPMRFGGRGRAWPRTRGALVARGGPS